MTVQTARQLDPVPAQVAAGRHLAAVGTGLTALALVLIGSLHVLPPSNRVNPLTRTISEYALGGNGWLFNLGVLALAAGSAVVLVGLVRGGAARAAGAGSVLVGLWAAALVVVVIFEKTNWAVGPSIGGTIHRMASLVAFLSLPIGALVLAARALGPAGDPRWRGPATATRWIALAALTCLSPLFYAIGQTFFTDVPWYRVFPLGAMERLLGLAEVTVVLALGWWAIRAARPAPAPVAAVAAG